jgi:hypothetical protein
MDNFEGSEAWIEAYELLKDHLLAWVSSGPGLKRLDIKIPERRVPGPVSEFVSLRRAIKQVYDDIPVFALELMEAFNITDFHIEYFPFNVLEPGVSVPLLPSLLPIAGLLPHVVELLMTLKAESMFTSLLPMLHLRSLDTLR